MPGDAPRSAIARLTNRRWGRLLLVIAGIVLGQAILFGPSLAGRKILLPLDILAQYFVYIPMTPETQQIMPHDLVLSDLIYAIEPQRRFAVSELKEHRFPLWVPNQFAGAPAVCPKFSPFFLMESLVASPVILAWTQLFAALVAGLGAYAFCRRALDVGFWPAAIVAWCYPLTGFFILWQGFPTSFSVYWLPWLLWAVDATVRRADSKAAIGLSVLTGVVLVSGNVDVAAQVLLVSGLYALWCLIDAHRRVARQRFPFKIVFRLTAGWTLGFLIATPQVLPLVEYLQTGSRVERRSAGEEDRPPAGLSALPQVVLPDMYGSTRTGSLRITPGNQMESSAASYSGVLATLVFAPLAWCSRRHRSSFFLWSAIAFLGLSWCLNVPGLVQLLRLPGLNMMSHNRLVFATAFAILSLAAIGLDALDRNAVRWSRWFWIPITVLAALFVRCIYRSMFLPEPVATELEAWINEGRMFKWIRNMEDLWRLREWYITSNTAAAALCGLGIAGWLLLKIRAARLVPLVPVIGILMVADLLWFAHGRSSQSDPALYFPRIDALERVAQSTPGRIIGHTCLPAAILQTQGLRDIRGYDAIDPKRFVELLMLTAGPETRTNSYARTQWLSPRGEFFPPADIRIPPILDMLNVRYVIFRGEPPPEIHPTFQSPDYWILTNRNAMPRAFIPSRVETVTDDQERLSKLASDNFDPSAVAYVESPVDLPSGCRGAAEIKSEIPTRLTVSVKMETAGLVVLSDLWDKGWHARLNGQPASILRANHAVRGIVVPVGDSTLELFYEPAGWRWGLRLAGLATIILLVWLSLLLFQARQTHKPRE